MAKPSKWAGRLDTIARMAAEGKTDAEIAAHYGTMKANILQVRQYYRIPTNSPQHTGRWPQSPVTETPAPARQIETVTVDGVTYCSPGWASGATPDHRVKPRRK